MQIQKFIIVPLLFTLVLAVAPVQASAQGEYEPRTIQEQIAYLYGVISQLQARLNELRSSEENSTYRTISVGGEDDERGNYRIELDTFSAIGIEDDEAEFRSNIDLDGAAYAIAWFEYGEVGDIDTRSTAIRITNRGDDTRSYRRVVDDLNDDTRYAYRSVAEGPDGYRVYGDVETFRTDDRFGNNNDNDNDSDRDSTRDDEPDADTEGADRITRTAAYIYGEIDMNDYSDGTVFFVFGLSESRVEDALDEDEYRDIDTEEDELVAFIVETGHDSDREFYGRLFNLEEDERYYYAICVEYEDDDGDETLECGDIEDFRTDD